MSDININIEVKTISIKETGDHLNIKHPYRHTDKDEVLRVIKDLKSKLNIKGSKYKGIKLDLPKDNQIMQHIRKANEQLHSTGTKELNILLLTCKNEMIYHYWGILLNNENGVLTHKLQEILVNYENFNKSSLNNIDAILLSNYLSMYENEEFDISKAFNLLLPNIHNSKLNSEDIEKFSREINDRQEELLVLIKEQKLKQYPGMEAHQKDFYIKLEAFKKLFKKYK